MKLRIFRSAASKFRGEILTLSTFSLLYTKPFPVVKEIKHCEWKNGKQSGRSSQILSPNSPRLCDLPVLQIVALLSGPHRACWLSDKEILSVSIAEKNLAAVALK